MKTLRVATRKSELAMTQTRLVADRVVACAKALGENLDYELVSMTTEGDRRLDKSLSSFGGKGVFIKELEVALMEDRVDIAVHSLKDMPAQVLPQFKLAAVLEREDCRDAFISKGGVSGIKFMDLPAGARVGTGSIRRVVQLKALRPDLEYVPIRGNIQTRLAKLAELDGVVLAAAGLKRMGLESQITEYFSVEQDAHLHTHVLLEGLECGLSVPGGKPCQHSSGKRLRAGKIPDARHLLAGILAETSAGQFTDGNSRRGGQFLVYLPGRISRCSNQSAILVSVRYIP